MRPPGVEEPERLVREIVLGEALYHVTGVWPPHPDATGAGGNVPYQNGAVGRQVALHPLDVQRDVEAKLEMVLAEARHGYVAPDTGRTIEHERVRYLAGWLVELARG